MVVIMHGMNQSGADMPHFSGWDQVAELNGIITVFPTGARGTGYKATCSPSVANDIDFFDKMVEKVLADYPRADPARLYLSGHSMGCNFTTSIAIIRPNFAAVASASMSPATDVTGTAANGTALGPQVNKTVPMPIMISIGELDTIGGGNVGTMNIHAGTDNGFKNTSNGDSWFERNGVTDTAADAAKAYTNGSGMLSGWTFKNGNIPVIRAQWVTGRHHAVLPEEAFSLYDFLKNYSRDPETLKSYYQGTEIVVGP
jgi:poly(3-hydroxybutyrate) depolymerase